MIANLDQLANLLSTQEKPLTVRSVEVEGSKWKELSAGPGPVLRYGVHDGDVMLVVGQRSTDLFKKDSSAPTLSQSQRFAAAMKTIGGSDMAPIFYLDVKGIIATFNKFAPMLQAMQVPVIGEPGGVQKVLDAVGLGSLESISSAMIAQDGGFKTSVFVHAPGANKTALRDAETAHRRRPAHGRRGCDLGQRL